MDTFTSHRQLEELQPPFKLTDSSPKELRQYQNGLVKLLLCDRTRRDMIFVHRGHLQTDMSHQHKNLLVIVHVLRLILEDILVPTVPLLEPAILLIVLEFHDSTLQGIDRGTCMSSHHRRTTCSRSTDLP